MEVLGKECLMIKIVWFLAKHTQLATDGTGHSCQFVQNESRREQGSGTPVKGAPWTIFPLAYILQKGRDPREMLLGACEDPGLSTDTYTG